MSEVKRYAYRLSGVSQLSGFLLEVIEYSGDGLPYVLASDYDQLKAENDALMIQSMHRGEQLLTLRKQLDEAHALISSVGKYLDNPFINNWLKANGK